MTRDTSHLAWVLKHMPDESATALLTFTKVNPHWQGANWDDCLDALMDSDSHLELTEPLWDFATGEWSVRLIAAVGITLLYSSQMFAEAAPDEQWTLVDATIRNNPDPAQPERVWVESYQDGLGRTVAGHWRLQRTEVPS